MARAMEPRAAAPYRRLATMKALAEAGIPVTVMTAPLIPALNDMEMEKILEAAWEVGARSAHYTLVRLPWEIKDLFKSDGSRLRRRANQLRAACGAGGDRARAHRSGDP